MKGINGRTLRHLLYAATPVLVMLAGAELWALQYYKHRPKYWLHADRLVNPAYTSKPWFSEAFLEASFSQPNGWFNPMNTRLLFPGDMQNDYFAVERGARRTTGFNWAIEEGLPLKIFLLGGSTTYCSGVPDSLTWASHLQRRLAQDESTRRLQIHNYGVISANSLQEVERLRYELARGNRPDICVFYNGVNDVAQGVYNNRPQGTILKSDKVYRQTWLMRLGAQSALVRAVLDTNRRRTIPAHLRDPARVRQLAKRTAQLYEANMREAIQLCTGYGVAPYIVLQPNLYTITGRPMTSQEKWVLTQSKHPGMKRCVEATYPLLREKIRALQADGYHAYDLSSLYNDVTEPIFLDFCHVESEGNRIIGQAIYDRIQTESTRVVRAAEQANRKIIISMHENSRFLKTLPQQARR